MALMAERLTDVPECKVSRAFEELFAQEYSRVVGVAFRVLGEQTAAEDVAQEAFYSFYRSKSAGDEHAEGWLHRAAAHLALNQIRSEKRRRRWQVAEASDRSRHEEHQQGALNPEQAIERLEQHRYLREALSHLPEKSATVLALRYSGLSYAEVAEAMNTKPGNIGTLLRRAEEALRKELNHASHH